MTGKGLAKASKSLATQFLYLHPEFTVIVNPLVEVLPKSLYGLLTGHSSTNRKWVAKVPAFSPSSAANVNIKGLLTDVHYHCLNICSFHFPFFIGNPMFPFYGVGRFWDPAWPAAGHTRGWSR